MEETFDVMVKLVEVIMDFQQDRVQHGVTKLKKIVNKNLSPVKGRSWCTSSLSTDVDEESLHPRSSD